jgi:hypothetical protein
MLAMADRRAVLLMQVQKHSLGHGILFMEKKKKKGGGYFHYFCISFLSGFYNVPKYPLHVFTYVTKKERKNWDKKTIKLLTPKPRPDPIPTMFTGKHTRWEISTMFRIEPHHHLERKKETLRYINIFLGP